MNAELSRPGFVRKRNSVNGAYLCNTVVLRKLKHSPADNLEKVLV